jgi:hypothetical protein
MQNKHQNCVVIIQTNGAHRVYHNYRAKNTTLYHSRKFTQESTINRLLGFGYTFITELEFNQLLNRKQF